MLLHKPLTFKHSGDRGDLVYALPTIKHLGGGKLYLNATPRDRVILEDGSLSLFNEAKIRSIIPLLLDQEYISEVVFWNGERVGFDFDTFRGTRNLTHYNLCDAQLEMFKVAKEVRDKPWLRVKRKTKLDYDIVIARSPRYHNHQINWREMYPFIEGRAVFVGHPSEHAAFQAVCGPLPYMQTNNMLELARIIDAAKIFIGNQSCPYAIAEGLKKTCILEVCPHVPNCLFPRYDCFHMYGTVSYADLARWEDNVQKVSDGR